MTDLPPIEISVIPETPAEIELAIVKIIESDGGGSPVTVTDSNTIDFTLTGQNITADIKAGSITTTELSTGVNVSLGKADTAVQPAALASYQPLAAVLTNTTASFTTAQETKLAGIAEGAEVNVNADWNAVSGDAQILNKPTLGTAAATDSTDYATAAQGTLANTALQSEDIGVTVQGYNSGTVIDPDYNTFTDAEKTKLEGIESGAQVNPDLSSYETTTQLNTRDTNNRNRANHTGTQTASTISDFDTEVSNNTDVAANTAARHDAVTVVDSSEIDFTLTGQQITASIVAGSIDESKLDASVNASLDLADSSVQLTGDQSIAGTKTFTTALILPNRSKINGVQHYYQNTKPDNPLELSAGDRWWKTDDGTEWFWNGTYWVTPKRTLHTGVNGSFSADYGLPVIGFDADTNNYQPILIEGLTFTAYTGWLPDTYNYSPTNYWGVTAIASPTDRDAGGVFVLNNAPILADGVAESPNSTNKQTWQYYPINTVYGTNAQLSNKIIFLRVVVVKTGSPIRLLDTAATIEYRRIYAA